MSKRWFGALGFRPLDLSLELKGFGSSGLKDIGVQDGEFIVGTVRRLGNRVSCSLILLPGWGFIPLCPSDLIGI